MSIRKVLTRLALFLGLIVLAAYLLSIELLLPWPLLHYAEKDWKWNFAYLIPHENKLHPIDSGPIISQYPIGGQAVGDKIVFWVVSNICDLMSEKTALAHLYLLDAKQGDWETFSLENAPLARSDAIILEQDNSLLVLGGWRLKSHPNCDWQKSKNFFSRLFSVPQARAAMPPEWFLTDDLLSYDQKTRLWEYLGTFREFSRQFPKQNTEKFYRFFEGFGFLRQGARLLVWNNPKDYAEPKHLLWNGRFLLNLQSKKVVPVPDLPTGKFWAEGVGIVAGHRLLVYFPEGTIPSEQMDELRDIYEFENKMKSSRSMSTKSTEELLVSHSGFVYDVRTNHWSVMSDKGAPKSGVCPILQWVDKKLLVWQPTLCFMETQTQKTNSISALYDPQNNSWRAMNTRAAPKGRVKSTHVVGPNLLAVMASKEDPERVANRRPFYLYTPSTNKWKNLVHEIPDKLEYGLEFAWVDGNIFIWSWVDGYYAWHNPDTNKSSTIDREKIDELGLNPLLVSLPDRMVIWAK